MISSLSASNCLPQKGTEPAVCLMQTLCECEHFIHSSLNQAEAAAHFALGQVLQLDVAVSLLLAAQNLLHSSH